MTGPRDPESPVGEREVLHHMVIAQQYEDGKLYQLSLRRGTPIGAAQVAVSLIDPLELSRAVWSTVHNPWDIEEYDDDSLYMTLWVENG